jgi:hypothetical protein
MAAKTYRSRSPGLSLPHLGVRFGGTRASSPSLGVPLDGVDEVDVAIRTRGARREHSGERTRAIGRGVFRTSDVALQRSIEASPLFADGSIWIEA